MTEQPKDYAGPADRLAGQDWAGTVRHTASSLAPAEKGWILAITIMFATLGGIFIAWMYFEAQNTVRASESLVAYLNSIHEQWLEVEKNRSMENRELLRQSETCTQALARQSDRLGRKRAEGLTIEQGKK